MKVLVTGGTGFVGREILARLHTRGHSIRVLARRPQSPAVQGLASQFGAEAYAGDVLDPASLQIACRGVDAVIHLVGIISESGQSTFENIHVRGTENVISAARAAGVGRLVHMSALGVRAGAPARYHQTKWAAEQRVRSSGLAFTIFRPSIIYGPKDGFVNLFARISRFSPIIPVMGNGNSRLQPLPVTDVAACFTQALDGPETIGATFDLCGREALTVNEILDTILSVTCRRRLKLHIPMWLARIQAAALECVLGKILHRPPPLNR